MRVFGHDVLSACLWFMVCDLAESTCAGANVVWRTAQNGEDMKLFAGLSVRRRSDSAGSAGGPGWVAFMHILYSI